MIINFLTELLVYMVVLCLISFVFIHKTEINTKRFVQKCIQIESIFMISILALKYTLYFFNIEFFQSFFIGYFLITSLSVICVLRDLILQKHIEL